MAYFMDENLRNTLKKVIDDWQGNEYVHPLTCEENALHANLEAFFHEDETDLCLKCPTCGHIQTGIPSFLVRIAEAWTE